MAEREQQITITTDTGAAMQSISELKQNIEDASEAAQTLNDALAATGSAMAPGGLDGAYADIAASAREAADALSELMEQATALESTLSASAGSMPDFSASVEKLDGLKISLESVIEIQERLSTGAGDMDPSAPWEEFEEKMQSVVEVYVQVRETVTATAESVAESETAQQAAAEKKADAIIAAYQKEQAQVTQSLGELKAQLEEYKLKMEEAAAAGDKIGQAEAIKGIEEMTGRIKELGKAQEQSAGRALGMTSGIRNLFSMFSTGQVSARGLIVSIKSIGTAIKTGLGPVGWGILILEGLSEAVNVFWNHLQGKSKAAAEEAEAARKKAEEEAKKMQEIKMDAVKAENAHKIRENADYMYRKAFETTIELERQTREMKHQLALKEGKIDQDIIKINSDHDKNIDSLKIQGTQEGWTDEELTKALRKNEEARTMELLGEEQKKLNAQEEANTQSADNMTASLMDLAVTLQGVNKGMIKSKDDVDLFVKSLIEAYTDSSSKSKKAQYFQSLLDKMENTPVTSRVKEFEEMKDNGEFDELSKKTGLSIDQIHSLGAFDFHKLKNVITTLVGAYKQEAKEFDDKIIKLESEVREELGGEKRNEKGQYSEESIETAAGEKAKKVDELNSKFDTNTKLLKDNYNQSEIIAQRQHEVVLKQKLSQERFAEKDLLDKTVRESEANKYKMDKTLEKMIEEASIKKLTKMYEDAQAALDTANQSGSKKDIQEAEQLADKIKKILDDKEESSNKMTKEIEDVIAEALKDKRLSKKDKQGLSQMQEMLKIAASDGNIDISELQRLAPYVDAAAKSSEGVKDYAAQMANATIDMAKSQAEAQGNLEGKFKALANRLQNELDDIKRQMNKRKN